MLSSARAGTGSMGRSITALSNNERILFISLSSNKLKKTEYTMSAPQLPHRGDAGGTGPPYGALGGASAVTPLYFTSIGCILLNRSTAKYRTETLSDSSGYFSSMSAISLHFFLSVSFII